MFRKPRIAILQSMNIDARNGIFLPQAFSARGYEAYSITPDAQNLAMLLVSGCLQDVSGKVIKANEIDVVIWRAKLFSDFEITQEIHDTLTSKHEVLGIEKPDILKVCRGKISTYNSLKNQNSVAMPKTQIVNSASNLTDIFSELSMPNAEGRLCVFVKPDFGFQGKGARRIYNIGDLASFVKEQNGEDAIVQAPIMTDKNFTWRVDLVGSRMQHVMKFHAADGSDTSTSKGSWEERIDNPPQNVIELALKAHKELGGPFLAGMDIIEGKDGDLYFLEANVPAIHYLGKDSLGLLDPLLDKYTKAVANKFKTERSQQYTFER